MFAEQNEQIDPSETMQIFKTTELLKNSTRVGTVKDHEPGSYLSFYDDDDDTQLVAINLAN